MLEKRRTKIVATIGPATSSEAQLQKMIQAGMNIARLNFSHGTHEDHKQTFDLIRKLSERLGKPVSILQDLQGVKIRTGDVHLDLTFGEEVVVTTAEEFEEGQIHVDYPELHQYLDPGKLILIDDGNLALEVKHVEGREAVCTVITGGQVKPHKGINLPGVSLDIPGFTEKDEEDLKFGLKLGVDAVAVSFVSSAEDIARVRRAIAQTEVKNCSPLLIAKMERPEAVNNLDSIIEISDGVMVARGDLGVEMQPEEVPIIQKRIIEIANRNRKIVITATQMLDSMIQNPRPTRAETTDVANAIFDGTDAVMLSGETAIGKYPLRTMEMMHNIISKSEEHLKEWGRWRGTPSDQYRDDAEAIAGAARELAHDLNVEAVVVFTSSGRTARVMSKARPRVPIVGFTPEIETYRRMAFYWGVYPNKIPKAHSIEEMLHHVDTAMVAATPIKPGQQVVVICGFPVNKSGLPNLALLHTVGEDS
jgi:pyruvate kinase